MMDGIQEIHKAYIERFSPAVFHRDCKAYWTARIGSDINVVTVTEIARHVRVCHECGNIIREEDLIEGAVKYTKKTRIISEKFLKFFTKEVEEEYWDALIVYNGRDENKSKKEIIKETKSRLEEID